MHDAARVQRVQPGADVRDEAHDGVDRQGTLAPKAGLEGLAVDEGDREVGPPVGLSGIDDRDQVPVLNLAGRPSLVHEAATEDLVVVELGSKDLQRHDEAVGFAHGTEDDPHPALAERSLQPVGAEAVAGAQIRHGARIDVPALASFPARPCSEVSDVTRAVARDTLLIRPRR